MVEWFTVQQAGIVGGVAGAAFGTLGGGVMGPLIGVCAPRGKYRGPILAVMTGFIVLGFASLAVALVAWIQEQPGHVIFPFLLLGALMVSIMGILLPVVKRVYQQAEQRKLQAEELRRGS